jgi:uncharacterized repeat protein (TIGR01451 family)
VINNVALANGGSTDSNTVCVSATPIFTIAKTATPSTTTPGTTVNYKVTVTNGGSAAGSTSFVDDFDDRLTPTGFPTPACSIITVSGNQKLSCTTASIAARGSQDFTYSAKMPATFTGPSGVSPCATGQYLVSNTATLANGGSQTANVCVTAAPNLVVSKTYTPAHPKAGDPVTYTVTVTNNGTAAGSTTFTDNYDDRLTITGFPAACTNTTTGDKQLTCPTGTILAGGHVDFSYTASMPASFTGTSGTGGCSTGEYPVVNAVVLSSGGQASVTVCVAAAPDFTVTKSASPTTGVNAGDPVTYTITVANGGTAAGSTAFVDDYDNRLSVDAATVHTPPGGSCTNVSPGGNKELSCTTSTINAGGSQMFTYTVNMPATFTGTSGGGGCAEGKYPITNVATLTNARHADVTVCVAAAPIMAVTKAADRATANPNDTINYTLTVTNSGTAPGSTTATDDFDDRLTVSGFPSNCSIVIVSGNATLSCNVGPVAAGGQSVITYQAKVPATFSGNPGGSAKCTSTQFPVVNQVTLSTGGGDSATVCVNATAKFTVVKTATPNSVDAGGTVNYKVTVTNGGTAPGSTSFIDDFDDSITPTGFPPSCSIITVSGNRELSCSTTLIPAGGHQDFSYSATMPASFTGPAGGSGCTATNPQQYPIKNAVTLSSGGTAMITVCVNAAPIFKVIKTASPLDAGPGQPVTYTVTVKNTGTAAGSTSFTDDYDNRLTLTNVPAACTNTTTGNKVLTCTTDTILAGGQQVFTYKANMPATFDGPSGGSPCPTGTFPVSNTATGATGDSSTVTVCVPASASFLPTKSANPSTAQASAPVTYTVTITNNGTASGTATFIDDYDDRLNVDPSSVTSDPPGATCTDASSGGNKKMSCPTGTILAGGHQTFTYTVNMPATFSGNPNGEPCGTSFAVVNTVTINGGGSTGNTVCVTAAPDFRISKSVNPQNALPDQSVTYTVTVSNVGTASGSTKFTDDYDDRLTLTGYPTPACSTSSSGGNAVLNCTTDTIAAGGSQIFTYSAKMPSTFTGPSGGAPCQPGQFPVSNKVTTFTQATSSATVCVTAAPAFTIGKTASPTAVSAGDLVTYTVTVANGGNASGATSFVDDFDDRLAVTASSVTISPAAGASCSVVTGTDGNKTLNCNTGTIVAGGQQTFSYQVQLPTTFTGSPGGSGCGSNQFPVINTARLDATHAKTVIVCVTATPNLVVTKTASPTSGVTAGSTVTYTIKVTNNGTAPGSTMFTDNYDDRLTPSAVAIPPSTGGSCSATQNGTDKVLRCTTGTINPGNSQTFTYTAQMPSAFTGNPGGNGCSASSPQQYAVVNTVTLDSGGNSGATVCVNAAPIASVSKTGTLSVDTDGSQSITYTIAYNNTGTAAAQTAVVSDSIPAGTSFVSCNPNCSQSGSPTNSVSWSVGPVAAGTGSFVTLVVKVTSTTLCQISNAAQLKFDTQTAATSNTVSTPISPLANPSGAHANGSATGAQILTSGILNINTSPISHSATSQSGVGGPALDNESVVSIGLPPVLSADVLRTTSASAVTPLPNSAAIQTSSAETAHICVLPIAGLCTVEANSVRAVASTFANGNTASYSSAGSTIQNLKVVGLGTPVDLNQTTTIKLNALIFGKNSYVAINERAGSVTGPSSSQTSGGTWAANLTVTMIHVKITGLLGLQAAEVIVGQAIAHSDYPQTTICGPSSAKSVSGDATIASVVTSLHLADLYQGYVAIPPTGGSASQHIVGAKLPADGSLASAGVADSSTTGSIAGNPTSTSIAAIVGNDPATPADEGPACVLRLAVGCVVSADVIHSEAHSTATKSGGSVSTDTGTSLVNVNVLGIKIAATPAPNTVLAIPGIGYIVLNEQVCDGGGLANHTCTGKPHSGITVREIDIVVNVALNPLGLIPGARIVVAEAHADTTQN